MIGWIGHLHCRYRLLGANGSADSVATRLDRLVRERIAPTLEGALEQSLAGDPTVYVLRKVEAQLGMRLDEGLTDTRLAQRWGERLAGAIMLTIARDPGDGANLVRYADQAEYVASFVIDLLNGKAGRCWYYKAFLSSPPRTTQDILRSVLLDNRDHLPAILGHLRRRGALERLLAAVDAATHRLLWSQGLGAYPGANPDSIRPLLIYTLRLLDQLELWERSPPESEQLLQRYLVTRPSPVDWRDRSALASALVDILHFLADQGYLRTPADKSDSMFLSRLDQALEQFDWLDRNKLRDHLLAQPGASGARETDLPFRPSRRGATPRQRELLADLIELLRTSHLPLDPSRPESPANALHLYALIVENVPGWAGDSLLTATIQRLLAAWRWLMRTRSPTRAMRWISQGDMRTVLRQLPEADQAMARRALDHLSGLGEPGFAIAEALVHAGKGASPASGQKTPRTPPDAAQPAFSGMIQALANLDLAEMAILKTMFAGATVETLQQLRQGDFGAVLTMLPHDSRTRITGLLEALAGLDAGILKEIKAIFAGMSTQSLHRLGRGDFEAGFPPLAPAGRARITAMLEALAEMDTEELAVIATIIEDPSADAFIQPQHADAHSVLPALSDEGRARIANVLGALEHLEGADLGFARASLASANQEMLDSLRQGDIETLLDDLYTDFYARVAPVLKAYAGLDEGVMLLAKLLTTAATLESLRLFGEGDPSGAIETLLKDSQTRIMPVFEALTDLDEAEIDQLKTLVGDELGDELDLPALDLGVETGCAAVFLLLRAVLDARLPALLKDATYPPSEEPDPASPGKPDRLAAALVALGLRWAGEAGLIRGRIDAGLSLLARPESPLTLDDLRAVWAHAGQQDHSRFQAALLRVLAAHRLLRASEMHLYQFEDSVLVAGCASSGPWPLGQTLETKADARGLVVRWLDVWEKTTGTRPDFITCDDSLADAVDFNRISASPDVVVMSPSQSSAAGEVPDSLIESHRAGREALLAALVALEKGRLDLPDADLTLALTAITLLRLWARWLRQFETSSVPYLLDNFIRRPGTIYVHPDHVLVEIETGPLDIVIEMASYTAELERLSWLGDRRVRFQLRD